MAASSISSPPPEAFFIVPSPAVCREGALVTDQTLESGGFLKRYTSVKVHIKGSVTGACDSYYDGQFWYRQERTISSMTIDQVSPSTWHQPVYSDVGPAKDLDTRVSGQTSGPATTSFSVVGPHNFLFQTQANSTNCMIDRFSPYTSAFLNAVSCTPTWVRRRRSSTPRHSVN